MSKPGFWDNQQQARQVSKRLSQVKRELSRYRGLIEKLEDLEVLIQLGQEEDEDSLKAEIDLGLKKLQQQIDQLQLTMLLDGEYDDHNALLAIHPGAGGLESQDWAEMLLRMYRRWAEKEGFEVQTLEFMPGEEAGIKSATLLIEGDYAFGYLQSEKGVHRLVRISPFDASGRRHTSFSSVDVLPEIDEELEIEIDEEELVIDTFRASGAGGQHVNTTDSAVRITHLPTKITVQCQNERSQHRNRQGALKILKSRLFDYYEARKMEELEELRGDHKQIAWGSQIRSYTFHPYRLIKDHRTGVEVGDVDRIMNGDLEPFIQAYLREKE